MFSLTIGNFGAQTFKVSNLAGLPDLMDKFLVAKRNGVEVVLSNIKTRKVLRRANESVTPEVVEKVEAIKLSDAMRKVLEADENETLGLPGRANTFKALEARGLVKIQADGVARRTELGNKYARKG